MQSHPRLKEEKKKYKINRHNFFACGATTLVVHPLRLILNAAATTKNPFAACKSVLETSPLAGAHVNLARGFSATAAAATTKDFTQEFCGGIALGSMISLGSAGIAGTFATPIETYFMRHNCMLLLKARKAPVPPDTSKLFYNRYLSVCYLARELSFVASVFGSENASQLQRTITYIAATYISSSAHKFATIESTKDILNITNLVPDWSDGFKKVFSKIMKNEYQLPSLKGIVNNPKNIVHYTVNLVSATCHLNMFGCRFVYLYSFSNLFSYFRKYSEETDINQLRLFNRKIKSSKQEEQHVATNEENAETKDMSLKKSNSLPLLLSSSKIR